MIEIHKTLSQINLEIIWSYFTHKDMSCNLRKGSILSVLKTHSFYYGMNAVYFRGPLLPAVKVYQFII